MPKKGTTAYEMYPDLNDETVWQQSWHQPLRGQKVRRHVNLKTGEIVDTYTVTGSTYSVGWVTPAVLRECDALPRVEESQRETPSGEQNPPKFG